MLDRELPRRAALEVAQAHGIHTDRCDVLQDGHTMVLRLTEDLVARVVTELSGPREGLDWFVRETAVVQHLTTAGAPVIPLHPSLPAGPHEHLGYHMNFWEYVHVVADPATPGETGQSLFRCHDLLRDFPGSLPRLAILTESIHVLETLEQQRLIPPADQDLLRRHLEESLEILTEYPAKPLHGDAHPGNLLNTNKGLLWTDWEDTFAGPVEWDVASIIWNAKILEGDPATVDSILASYQAAGGSLHEACLDQCLTARAAVMSAWYPILYPAPTPARQEKLQRRMDWLRHR